MFDRAWIERELAGLIVQLHQTEGAISVLQQMLQQVDGADLPPQPGVIMLPESGALLPPGLMVDEEMEPHER